MYEEEIAELEKRKRRLNDTLTLLTVRLERSKEDKKRYEKQIAKNMEKTAGLIKRQQAKIPQIKAELADIEAQIKHFKTWFICPECQREYKTEEKLGQHIQKKHPKTIPEVVEEVIEKTVTVAEVSEELPYFPTVDEDGNPVFECKLCGKQYEKEATMKGHHTLKHKIRKED